ncbi:MAG: tRNA pseudouridine(55) synthase TruB [Leptospira sp.]|nr:tRNA pseudouridine(55) synthase TruB [Leptospira sp.]
MHSGFILFDKSSGITSSDAVVSIKKLTRIRRIGHTGTLDKFANGLLILPFGDCTAFSEIFLKKPKSYECEILFGVRTDSGDSDGSVLEKWDESRTSDFYSENLEQIHTEIRKISEWKIQIPPKISALKINGKRQADLFRKGVEFESIPRPIEISDLSFSDLSPSGFLLKIRVSSGTYIRKIIDDLGGIIHLPMCLKSLRRTEIGSVSVTDAVTMEQMRNGESKFLPLEELLPLRVIFADAEEKKKISHGQYFPIRENFNTGDFLVKSETGELLAWCSFDDLRPFHPFRYKKVFQGE